MGSPDADLAARPATGSGAHALLERDREIALLGERVRDAAAGNGGCVVIEGPAGIGKTRLLTEARGGAEADMRIVAARGSDLERDFPFGVVRQLFEALLADVDRRELLLTGAAAPAATVFGALDESGGDPSFATLHGLFWLTLNLAEERPVMLAVDDVQWADRASLRFLAYLVRRLEGVPVLLAATLRTAEPGTDTVLIGELLHDPAATVVRPASLSREAVDELVRQRLGAQTEQGFCAACATATGGNPLLLRQLLTALESDGVAPVAANAAVVAEIGPRAVSRTVLPRFARLDASAVAVARAAAVLGEGAPLSVLAALAGIDERALGSATGELARVEILRPDSPIRFVHPLVREAVYRDLPPGEREAQHAEAARLLREHGAPDDHVAAQLLLAPARGEAWVADLLQQAGRAAVRRGASESAAAYLRRAHQEPPPPERRTRVLFELGSAEALTSGPDAVEHLRAAYDALDDPPSRSVAAGLLGRLLMFTGAPSDGLDVARRALAELPPQYEDERRALEAFCYMTVYFGAGDARDLDRLRSYRAPVPRDAGPGAHMLAACAAWHWLCEDGNAAETSALALSTMAGGVLMEADSALIGFAPPVALALADRDEALQALDESYAVGHRTGSLFTVSSLHMWRGYTLYLRGDISGARELLETALQEYATWGFGSTASLFCGGMLADVLRESGEVAQARRVLDDLASHRVLADKSVERDGRPSAAHWNGIVGTAEAGLLLAEERWEEALAAADALRDYCGRIGDPARLWWRSLRAQALVRLERPDEARATMQEELEVARAWGAPGALGRSLRLLGSIDGDLDTLADAVDVLEGTAPRLEHAKALTAYGAALRRARKPTDAREPLRRALDLANACGAPGIAELARAELHAAGARPRTDALAGPAALTPSERRVAELAVDGGTNREIAQTLFVTPKTVEVHLSNAYRKLGIRSRRELAASLTA